MSRKPRADVAANNRVTTRLTSAELATLRRLSAAAQLDASTLIRRLIEDAGLAANFLDARHSYDVFHRDSTVRALPIWVYTLHHVPGRPEPLCVRRKVTSVNGTSVTVELGQRLSASFDYDDFATHGFALSGGWTHPDRHYGDEVRFGLMPHVVAYLNVPAQAERDEWRRCRRLALDLLQASHVWSCWGGSVRRFKTKRVHPDGGDFEHRGDVIVEVGGGAELHFNAFTLAYGTNVGACPFIEKDGGWSVSCSDNVHIYLERPSTAESAEQCRRERDRRKAFEVEAEIEAKAQERRRQEAHRRAQEQKAKDIFDSFFGKVPSAASLNELGLKWPCTEDDVRRAAKKRRAELHPDRHGGSTAAHEAFCRIADFEAEAQRFVRLNSIAVQKTGDR